MKIYELLSEAPTLGAPTAQQNLANLGAIGKPKPKVAGPNLLGGIAQGFKKGMGMDPTDSLAKGAALKGLQSTGFNQTANALAGSSQPNDQSQDQEQDPNAPVDPNQPQQGTQTAAKGKLPLPGTIIKDPKYGNIKVMQTPAGQKGVKLDTTQILGFPVVVDPSDLAR
jgi:hypothetical protein